MAVTTSRAVETRTPPLATVEVDREALKRMEEWIRTMKRAEKKR
jgi:hypothetical protein